MKQAWRDALLIVLLVTAMGQTVAICVLCHQFNKLDQKFDSFDCPTGVVPSNWEGWRVIHD